MPGLILNGWNCTDKTLKLMQENSMIQKKERGAGNDTQFAVEIWEGDRVLVREPVSRADLIFARDETWIHGLRTGNLGWNLNDLSMSVLPGKGDPSGRLSSYYVELGEGERTVRREFSMLSLSSVAVRAKKRLGKQDSREKDRELIFYLKQLQVDSHDRSTVDSRAGETARGMGVGTLLTRRTEIPDLESASLTEYLRDSEILQSPSLLLEEDQDVVHVFLTREVWDQTDALARRGGDKESAAMWTGRLMKDGASPEFFMRIDCCIPAELATEETYSVTFSGSTWADLEGRLAVRRKRLNRPAERFLGSVHGHNFPVPPDAEGNTQCAACSQAEICGRTTAFLSQDDERWHRSVFLKQPWATLLIYGWNARGEKDFKLYGLKDGRLQPRSLRLFKTDPK